MAYMENECGCAVSFDALPLIRYCLLHAAAPAMYEYIKGQAGGDCHRYDKHFRTNLPVKEQTCGECESCRARAIIGRIGGL